MATFSLADATDLERWADRLESNSKLPHLMRRLITATGKGLTGVSIRAGEGVQFPGWDGKVKATEAHIHVPGGDSVWEMGTNKRIAEKANSDYKKRSANPDGADPAETTYVFVTPRRWAGKDKWVEERNAEGTWKEVRAYDADDLEHWLERARGAHLWFSDQVGKDPGEAESLEIWWESWSQSTVPAIPPALLLSGRKEIVERVRDHVQQQDPAVMTVAGDSQQEVIAFVAAVLQGEEGLAGALERAVIVETPAAWRRLAASEEPLILVPIYEKADVALALRNGHHVIVPVGREVGTDANNELPRLRRHGVETALKEAGLPDSKASRLATLGRRSLLSLRRTMAVSPEVQTPEWAKPEHARDILPAMLAGRWLDSREGDREAISKLARRPYEEYAATLTKWANSSDPPVRRVGNVWLVSAKQDAWTLLARHLMSDDLQRFREVAIEVLGSDDPSLELPPNERLVASTLGKVRPYSSHLLAGVADTLALMGAVSDAVPLAGGRKSEDEAAVIVRELLESANEAQDAKRWSLLSGVLPALAEATPEVFLRAVNAGLSDEGPILGVFQDHGEDYDVMFGGSSAHTGLLWALETLAWSPDHVVQATLALAKLAANDPGGRLGNRPINSLRAIHVLWSHGTAATIEQRLQAIDVIRERVPEVAWSLLLDLIPTGHGSTSSPHGPTWRDWKPEDPGGVLYADLYRGVDAVCERVLADAKHDPVRWAEVVKRYVDFPPPLQKEVLGRLRDLDPQELSEETRRVITDACRDMVARHRAYPEADWSMSAEDLERLEASYAHLEPTDLRYRHRWLFVQGSVHAFREEGNYRERHTALQKAQTVAVIEVLDQSGLEGVFEWAGDFEDTPGPRWIGNALAGIDLDHDNEESLLDALASEDVGRRQMGTGFVERRVTMQGTDWVKWAETITSDHPDWSPAHRAEFLATLPPTPQVWDIAEAAGGETDEAYWHRAQYYGLPERGDACVRAALKLVEHGRPHTAVDLLDLYAMEIPEGPPDHLVADALEKTATTDLVGSLDHMFTHHVGNHLDRLAEHGFDEDRLARLEWMYLRAFRFDKRRFPVLHGALANDPGFFVEVVSMVYRADGEEPRELTETEKAAALNARELLHSWRDVPGTQDDGTIDKEKLFEWVREARRLLSEASRLGIGDEHIGRVLRYGPPPEGDKWPCEPIRDLIEAINSDQLDGGVLVEIYNSRGTTSRGPTEGGAQERALVEQYQRYARFAAASWPRTADLLNSVARSYAADARRNDLSADLTQDLWR